MRDKILRYGAVFAVTLGLGAWTAHAGSITGYKTVDLRINQDSQGQNEDGDSHHLILGASLGAPLGAPGLPKPPTIQGVLDLVKPPPSAPGSPGFYGGIVGGGTGPIKVGLPGVNPIPEPRTWVLYVFGALLGIWVVRQELRESS